MEGKRPNFCRDREIARLVCDGMTMTAAGEKYGITSGRVRQVVNKVFREEGVENPASMSIRKLCRLFRDRLK